MFSISPKTIIHGLEKTGCSISHIQHCIYMNKEPVNYSYFGPRVAKGSLIVHTKNGDFTIRFHETNGWADEIQIV